MLMFSHNKTVLFFTLTLMVILVLPVNADGISDEWKNSIEAYLQQVDADTTAEIVVYIVQSLRGHGIKKEGSEINEIVKLGVYIFNELPLETPNGLQVGIGKEGKDNGVLVLVAMEEREWRIEVGYGLEGYITDIESNLIAQEHLIPKFKEGKYGEGLYETVVALAQEIPVSPEPEELLIRGRYFYENLNPPLQDETPLWVTIILIGIFVAVVVVIVVVAYLVKKGKIKVEKTRSSGYGGQSGGSRRGKPSSGRGRKGGRSGGAGAKGKW